MKVPWLFDMRGFWVDEKVMKGSIRRGGLGYLWLKSEEKKLLRDAAAIVSLTKKAIPHITELVNSRNPPRIAVIPTCTDLSRFQPIEKSEKEKENLVVGYIGSLGSGYEGDLICEFIESTLRRYRHAEALVVTQTSGHSLRDLQNNFPNRLTVTKSAYEDMPGLVGSMSIGLSFITPDESKDASCPTKLGEYLACGIPVVGNRGIGDTDEIVSEYRVGVLCSGKADFERTFEEIESLLERPEELSRRCRDCAEQVFSVEKGARAYDQLYRSAVPGW